LGEPAVFATAFSERKLLREGGKVILFGKKREEGLTKTKGRRGS